MDVVKALIEAVTQDLVKYLCEDRNIPINEAMKTVYNSITFEKLSDVNTGLYRESSAYVFDLLKGELTEGKFVQMEI